jgi:hypothetical protein
MFSLTLLPLPVGEEFLPFSSREKPDLSLVPRNQY